MGELFPLSILVVEDEPLKLKKTVEVLERLNQTSVGGAVSISSATCFSEAQSLVSDHHFDLVVLDLRIPVMPGEDPRIENSASLYRFLKVAENRPFFVLGLTSASENEVSAVFSQTPSFSIHRFDEEGVWFEVVRDKIGFVEAARLGLRRYLSVRPGLDVLIVTARRGNEFDPILQKIDWIGGVSNSRRDLGGLVNAFGQVEVLPGHAVSIGVVCLDEMGLSHSAAVVAWLSGLLRPRLIGMLGMCCGLQKIPDPSAPSASGKTKLGDVIVATSTCCWDEGKYAENDAALKGSALFNNRAVDKRPSGEFERRLTRFLDASEERISEVIASYYRSLDTRKLEAGLIGGVKFSPAGRLLWGHVVSGACVVDSSQMIGEIEGRFPRAIGLEMEAHSVYSAVSVVSGFRPEAVVIKGVADFGDGTKAKSVQPVASVASLLVFLDVIRWFFSGEDL